MKPTVAIGDIHGKSTWKQIVNLNQDCDFIFIGDFFDDYENTSHVRQIDNFKDILEFKRRNSSMVTVLFGNHDFHYLNTLDRYSGYQALGALDIQEAIYGALKEGLMQMCKVIYDGGKKILFVHAGVTKTWCRNTGIDIDNLEKSINDKFTFTPEAFRYTSGGTTMDMTGDEICQTPIWVRPNSLFKDNISGYIQVVGHTARQNILLSRKIKTKGAIVERNDIILIDALDSKEYLKVVDGVFSVENFRYLN